MKPAHSHVSACRHLNLVSILVLCLFGVPGCNTSQPVERHAPANPPEGDLVALGFEALRTGDISLVEPWLMDEDKYRQFIRDAEWDETDRPSDEEVANLAKEARDSLAHSVPFIRTLLPDLRFDLDAARLEGIFVLAPSQADFTDTRWMEFSPSDQRSPLDISYLIEFAGNRAEIKLNDTFLIEGRRYVARGFRFPTYRPMDRNDAAIRALVIANQLDGPMPKPPKDR